MKVNKKPILVDDLLVDDVYPGELPLYDIDLPEWGGVSTFGTPIPAVTKYYGKLPTPKDDPVSKDKPHKPIDPEEIP